LVRFDQDCAALSLSERYLEAKAWTPDDNFRAQTGKPPKLTIDTQRGVRLAFLDTQPTGEEAPKRQGRSPHGYTLAKIAQDLVCTPKPNEQKSYEHCAAKITTQLALPIVEFNAKSPKHNKIDENWGGYLGMQSDLAQAIQREVDAWQTSLIRGSSQRHLVLNLSMAWDGELFGGLADEPLAEMRAGTQAVYRALQYAAGFDALVLAAAGNQKAEPCKNNGPLLPAAWEREAPREDACPEAEERSKKPLIHAVGGIRANGDPLANARFGGMPRRAGYGETSIFTGSSVATAIASSIAAVVWNAFPDLNSHQVMDILDTNGEHLSFRADFWSGSSALTMSKAPMAHRLSLCTALTEACSRPQLSSRCPIQLPCAFTERRLFAGEAMPAKQGSCQPWGYPQPEDDPCAACIKPPGGPPPPGI
jgi:hypothetical protein